MHVSYPGTGRRPAVHAVDDVSFTIAAGQIVGLVGESGSGKSSIGSVLLGLVEPDAGRLIFAGQDITRSRRRDRRLIARQLQAVFQDPFGSMNPTLTVGDTLAETLRYNLGLSHEQIHNRLGDALTEVGLDESVLGRYPAQFSGGQRQRLAIARAIAVEPSFLICDEAVSALDLSVQAQVLNLLMRLRTRRNLSYLFISHDLAVVRYLSDQIVVLYAGRIVERGPAEIVGERPSHPYTQALLAAAPVADPDEQTERRARRTTLTVRSERPATGCSFADRCPFAIDRCRVERPELIAHASGAFVACHRADELTATTAPAPSSRP
nr:ABC transporter ATP-binding protein [Flexivirga aerilata]